MQLQVCPHCGTMVVFSAAGICPACRHTRVDVEAVAEGEARRPLRQRAVRRINLETPARWKSAESKWRNFPSRPA